MKRYFALTIAFLTCTAAASTFASAAATHSAATRNAAFTPFLRKSAPPMKIEMFHYAAQATDETLKYGIGIDTLNGFALMVPAKRKLPVVYSETFANAEDNQKSVQIELSQQMPEGAEKIAVVNVEIPPRAKGKASIIVTLKIDRNKNLTIKVSVMETSLIEEFGPFPVQ